MPADIRIRAATNRDNLVHLLTPGQASDAERLTRDAEAVCPRLVRRAYQGRALCRDIQNGRQAADTVGRAEVIVAKARTLSASPS